jgi:hypothetical protein
MYINKYILSQNFIVKYLKKPLLIHIILPEVFGAVLSMHCAVNMAPAGHTMKTLQN